MKVRQKERLSVTVDSGLVAGFSQASVGSFVPGNIWTTFLIGFGWQGVMAGVGGSAAAREKAVAGEEGMREVKEEALGTVKTVVAPLLKKIEELQDQVREAESIPPPASDRPLGEVVEGG
jgi:hypothetical protein